jgi:hypothetical protein
MVLLHTHVRESRSIIHVSHTRATRGNVSTSFVSAARARCTQGSTALVMAALLLGQAAVLASAFSDPRAFLSVDSACLLFTNATATSIDTPHTTTTPLPLTRHTPQQLPRLLTRRAPQQRHCTRMQASQCDHPRCSRLCQMRRSKRAGCE